MANDIISQAANDILIFHNVYCGNCENLNDDLKILKIIRNILKILKIIRNFQHMEGKEISRRIKEAWGNFWMKQIYRWKIDMKEKHQTLETVNLPS